MDTCTATQFMSVWPDAERRRPGTRRRASNPLRVVAIAGLAGAAVLLAGVVMVDAVATRVVPKDESSMPTASSTAVISARRTPLTLSTLTRLGRVRRSLASSVGSLPPGSCATVDWEGVRLLAVNAPEPLVPASAMKVITAAAALEVLGADHVYETSVHATIDSSGVAPTVWLVGGGDPLLVSASYPSSEKYPTFNETRLEALADQVIAAGLRVVTGVVAGVDTRYDAERYVASWPVSFHMVEAGPLGALMVNDGVVPGMATKPNDPAVAAAQVFATLLAERGVVVSGGASRDVLPAAAPKVASVTSAPLVDQLQSMLVNSDNNASELILKEIGLKAKAIGSTAAGVESVTEILNAWGMGEGSVVADGSGLSRDNRISCATFSLVLDRLVQTLPALLPVAGETGTLRAIFDGQSIKGRLVAKTGTLSGVKSLVGYVPVENGTPVRFSIVMNASAIDNQSRYRPIWYSLGDSMGRASAVPSADDLMP